MYQNVDQLTSLDVYRDGGSLSASFRDEKGVLHTLLFLINNKASDNSKGLKIYKSALIETYLESDNVSPITGIASPQSKKEENPILWSEAIELLNKIKPFIDGYESDYLWVFDSMAIIANNEKHEIECT